MGHKYEINLRSDPLSFLYYHISVALAYSSFVFSFMVLKDLDSVYVIQLLGYCDAELED